MQAIDILCSEHRSLAAVLHGMLYIVRDIRLRGTAPRFDVLHAMVHYIDVLPERFHHPKEDAYLFRFLALRCQDAVPLIDQLQMEHRVGVEKSARLIRHWSDTSREAQRSFRRLLRPYRRMRPSTGIICGPRRTS